jgi:hypothetical protein
LKWISTCCEQENLKANADHSRWFGRTNLQPVVGEVVIAKNNILPSTTLSAEEFDDDVLGAKRAAQNGPVFITTQGTPSHVLLSIDVYWKLSGVSPNIIELLGMPGIEDIDFEPPRLSW